MAQSAGTTTLQSDACNSRNGTAQKHFESLKQKIRGVFEQNIGGLQMNTANSGSGIDLQ